MRQKALRPRRRRKTSRLLKRLPRCNCWATGWGFRPSSATCCCSARRWSWTHASPALCARAQDDPQKNFPTFALALALFDEPSWDALSPERPLRFWHLIEISQFGAQPLTASALRADERIVNYLKGLNYLDERLTSLLSPLELTADDLELAPSQECLVQVILRRWRQAAETGSLPVAQLVGADPQSKQLVAHHAGGGLESPAPSVAGRVAAGKSRRLGIARPALATRELPVAAGALSRRGRVERPGRTFRPPEPFFVPQRWSVFPRRSRNSAACRWCALFVGHRKADGRRAEERVGRRAGRRRARNAGATRRPIQFESREDSRTARTWQKSR